MSDQIMTLENKNNNKKVEKNNLEPFGVYSDSLPAPWLTLWMIIEGERKFSSAILTTIFPNSRLRSFQFNRVKRGRGTVGFRLVAKHRNLKHASCTAITWESLFSIVLASQYEKIMFVRWISWNYYVPHRTHGQKERKKFRVMRNPRMICDVVNARW